MILAMIIQGLVLKSWQVDNDNYPGYTSILPTIVGKKQALELPYGFQRQLIYSSILWA